MIKVMKTKSVEKEVLLRLPPYNVRAVVKGTCPLLLQVRSETLYDPRNTARQAMDTLDNYVYRDREGFICLPSLFFHAALVNGAKYIPDPRSSRRSAAELFKQGVSVTGCFGDDALVRLGPKPYKKEWDYVDTRTVRINCSNVPRRRPAFKEGWTAEFNIMVIASELVSKDMLRERLRDSGLLCGVGDFRPMFGRFSLMKFQLMK